MKYKLKKHNFNYLAKKYNLNILNEEITFDDENLKRIKAIGWAVERTSQILPWNGICLVKALAAYKLLKKYNHSGIIFMGVKKNDNNLEAHAWLKHNDMFLTGRVGHKEFTVVSKFTWNIND